jgi:hypothetical protein
MRYRPIMKAAGITSVFITARFMYAAVQPKRLSLFDPQVKPLLAKMTLGVNDDYVVPS